jgi:hypothetical protein
MLRVRKFETGDQIPEGATFLSTITEDQIVVQESGGTKRPFTDGSDRSCTISRVYHRVVWHFFLVECDEQGNPLLARKLPAS